MKNALYIEERERRLLLEERNRLARDIHDGLAQDLAGSVFHVEMMKRLNPAEVMPALDELQKILTDTVAKVRDSIYSLRPNPYIHIGLVPAIETLLADVSNRHKINTQFESSIGNNIITTDIAKAIFEIVSEGVQNVVKHAKATRVRIVLHEGRNGILRLTIHDDGQGFHFGHAMLKAIAEHSFGIENLHRLAENVGT